MLPSANDTFTVLCGTDLAYGLRSRFATSDSSLSLLDSILVNVGPLAKVFLDVPVMTSPSLYFISPNPLGSLFSSTSPENVPLLVCIIH